jgi:hypothetical protein
MTVPLRFSRGDLGVPEFATDDDAWSAFGSFLTADLQTSTWTVLDILEAVEWVRQGRSRLEEIAGNSWTGTITPGGLHLQDLYSDDWSGDYSLDDAHEGLIAYWNYLTADLGAKAVALEKRESGKGRPHPCRDHLG